MSRLAFVFLLGSLAAFVAGSIALSQTRDLPALYWLLLGAVSTKVAVRFAAVRARA